MYLPTVDAFRAAVKGRDEEVNLVRCALLIAHLGRPRIDMVTYERQIDDIAGNVRKRAAAGADVHQLINAVDHELFYERGFHGNTARYTDPENSYLDHVLDLQTGIPITLSLLYMEVARRAGMRCDGIGYPGHFIVRCGEPEEPVYVDPFHQGTRLDREELLAGLRGRNLGGASPESFLAAITRRQMLQRMLNNLRTIYCESGDLERWLGAVELALCIEPWNGDLIGERGMLRYRLGEFRPALEDLEQYAGEHTGSGHPAAMKMLEELRIRFKKPEGLR